MNVTESSHPTSKRSAVNQSARGRRSEAKYLLPILVPPLLVCLLFAFGKYQDAAVARNVQNELDRLGESSVMQNFRMTTASFDDRLDDTHSKAWLDVLQAAEWLYEVANDIDAPDWHFGNTVNGEIGEVHRRWDKSAAPILATVHKLVDAADPDSDPVWFPQVFSESAGLPALYSSMMIIALLDAEFQVAAADRDASKALKSLQSINGVIRAFDWQVGIGSEMNHQSLRRSLRELINDSLAMGLWKTDEQLVQLRALLSDRHSVEDRWKATWDQHYVYTLANWENEGRHISAFHHQYSTMPGTKNAILQSMRTISQSSVTNESGVPCRVGTRDFAAVFYHRQVAEMQHPTQSMTPSIVSLPFAKQRSDLSEFGQATQLAIYLAMDQIERRWTLTAIALKQFKMKEGHWPKNLQQLDSVGHSAADSIAVDNSLFEFRQDADGVGAAVRSVKVRSSFPSVLSDRNRLEIYVR